MTSKFLNISTDTTLGGSSASDNTVASQKAVKAYADTKQAEITSSNKLPASLVSGLATVATSGSYNDLSNKPTIDSALSTSSTNAAQNKVITSALNGKLDGFTLRFAGNWTGGAHAVNFITFDYSECNSENGIFIKLSMVNSHGNGITGRFFQDVILNCNYTGTVAGTIYRYFAENVDASMSYNDHKFGDIFWTVDTTNKIVKFYVLMRQYSYTYMTPYFRLNASTKGVISQKSGVGQEEYSSGTQHWASISWYETDQTYSSTSPKPQSGVAIASAISGKANSADLATVATSGSYNDLSNKPTIPTVNNATLTIQKNGSNVATFTANASSNVTANISVPTVTSTYTATGTDAVNGVAVSNAIATKQDNLVSGTNIKTINGTSLLGSGNITIETSSTPNVDGETISYNSSDALQTIAVKNKRDNSTLPIWHGTEYQWNHGDPTTWYYWQTSASDLWTYGNGTYTIRVGKSKAVYLGNGDYVITMIADGAQFNQFTVIYTDNDFQNCYNATVTTGGIYYDGLYSRAVYGNGVLISCNQRIMEKSTDNGKTWTQSSANRIVGNRGVFANNMFVFVRDNSDEVVYSIDDGDTWQLGGNLPSSGWFCITYGNGTFIVIGANKVAYSTDNCTTWTSATTPPSGMSTSTNLKLYAAYGNQKFVFIDEGNNAYWYSTDNGDTWTSNLNFFSFNVYDIAFGNDIFMVVGSSMYSSYTKDCVNWTETQMYSSSNTAMTVVYNYDETSFIALSDRTQRVLRFQTSYDKCYTTDQNPTTTSVVYSAPETTSALTVSSVTSGAITLSDNNTYYYNQSGNAYTYQTIGDAHPEYLCFIDGVGVKMGNTTIATNNSNS